MQSAHTFGCISLPDGMELISTELFLISDGPLGGASVWTADRDREEIVCSCRWASFSVGQE